MGQLAFNMPVLNDGIVTNPKAETNLSARRMGLESLLTEADFISLHLPLVPSTKSLFNREKLRMMKSSAYLINSSWGPVIDQETLMKTLEEKWIAGAGLDGFDLEPLPPDSPLLQLDNVVLSPQMEAHTDEALLRMAMVVEDVIAVIQGDPPKNPVI